MRKLAGCLGVLCLVSLYTAIPLYAKEQEEPEFTKSNVIILEKGSKIKQSVLYKGKKLSVKWKTSNPKIVTVSKKGWIKALKSGTVTVTASRKKSGTKLKCRVYVGKKITSLKTKTKYSVLKGKRITIKVSVKPKKAVYQKLTFVSSDKSIATVDRKGLVKGKRVGTCQITVSTNDGSQIEQNVLIKVLPIKVDRIRFSASEKRMVVGETDAYKPEIQPANATMKKVEYSSSNPDVATVTQSGKVTAKSVGTCRIYAMSLDGSQVFGYYRLVVSENGENMKHCLNKLNLVSVYGDNNAYHPSVRNFSKPWNGYKYWMAYTPFLNANDRIENPHIAVSNDMINWTVPKGFQNPLDPPDGLVLPRLQYNSDTHLVYRSDTNVLECYWRQVDKASATNTIFRRTTADGIKWTEKELVLRTKYEEDGLLSPAIIFEDGKYKMWTVDYKSNYPICYRESTDGKTWTKPRAIQITYSNPKLRTWHIDMMHTEQGYELLIVAFDTSREKMCMYYSNSKDNVNFSRAALVMQPSNNEMAWDNKGLYRSCFFKQNGKYNVFYSGIGKDGERGVGLSIGTTLLNMKGYDR